MNTEPWVTAEHVAQHLGVAKKTVYRWPEHKVLPAHRVGRLWKFQLQTWMNGCTQAAYLQHFLCAAHFESDLQRKASGTSGRKRATPEGFLSLEIPVPSLGEQDKLIAGFSPADGMEREAARLHQSAWAAFELALFTPAEPSAA
ncbi:MAG: excisionase family DNA-binding protein [Candidatus Nitrotoga sp.]|nr:excisionase family DNA-binding protein [Candidatus Nitrotoga sp.]MDP1856059.1 excisionase family DNA-binding protein [Candidatus Nitrotoga sp.]MDP3497568.1 excisionase family DNA-binding protein [Candidatus Nitrotoga sp.]